MWRLQHPFTPADVPLGGEEQENPHDSLKFASHNTGVFLKHNNFFSFFFCSLSDLSRRSFRGLGTAPNSYRRPGSSLLG
jgi:hypothetical protein